MQHMEQKCKEPYVNSSWYALRNNAPFHIWDRLAEHVTPCAITPCAGLIKDGNATLNITALEIFRFINKPAEELILAAFFITSEISNTWLHFIFSPITVFKIWNHVTHSVHHTHRILMNCDVTPVTLCVSNIWYNTMIYALISCYMC